MKKLFLTACVAVLGAFSLNAQGFAFRAEVGGNLATRKISTNQASMQPNSRMGLRFGFAGEYAFSKTAFLSGGLNYTMGGTKIGKDNGKDHYLTIPVNIGARFQVADNFALSIEGGPYAAVLLAANATINGVTADVMDFRKKVEVGLGISVAGEFQNRYYIRLGSDYGLTTTSKETIDDTTIKSRQAYLTLGLRF